MVTYIFSTFYNYYSEQSNNNRGYNKTPHNNNRGYNKIPHNNNRGYNKITHYLGTYPAAYSQGMYTKLYHYFD